MGGSDSAFDYQGAELLVGATAVFKSKGVAIAAYTTWIPRKFHVMANDLRCSIYQNSLSASVETLLLRYLHRYRMNPVIGVATEIPGNNLGLYIVRTVNGPHF